MSEYAFYDYIITNPEYLDILPIMPGYINNKFLYSIVSKLILLPMLSTMTSFNIYYILVTISFIHYVVLVNQYQFIYLAYIFVVTLFSLIIIVINVLYYRWNNFMDQVDKSEENMMSIIHDMKNPLIACEYLIELYLEGKDDPELIEFLNKLKTELTEAFSFTENYRFFYKETKSNEVNEKTESINLNDTLQSIMISNTSVCRNNQNKLKVYRTIKEPKTIQSKPIIFKRIINNLVSNALKHSFNKEVKLGLTSYEDYNHLCKENGIEMQTVSESNEHYKDNVILAIEVTDNGQGIQIDQQQKLFDSHATSNTSENFDGTGIGLSVARYLAEQVDGGVTFYSQPDVETKFIFYFYVQYFNTNSKFENDNNQISESKKDKTLFEINYIDKNMNFKNIMHKCYSLIIVEDNEVIRKMYSKMCDRLKLEYLIFPNGLQAYEFLEYYKMTECCAECNNRLLVLSDYQMPYMSGLQLYDYIKSDEILVNIISFYLVSADEFADSEFNTITKPLRRFKLKEVYENFRMIE